MQDIKISGLLILFLLILLLIGRLRTYFRTKLKGELLVVIGSTIFVFAYLIDNSLLGISGFIILNIGLIILVTIESGKQKEIYSQTSFFDRLIGNVPIIEKKKFIPPNIKKGTGILTGVFCLIFSIILFSTYTKDEIIEMVVAGMFAFSGIFFIIFSIFKGK